MSDLEVFKSQSVKEEISNAISHGIAAALFIFGTVIMIIEASLRHKGAMAITGVSIFGASLILLYLTSCLYHSLTNYNAKRVFRKLDHCMIFILITGTYTPICLSIIRGWAGSQQPRSCVASQIVSSTGAGFGPTCVNVERPMS